MCLRFALLATLLSVAVAAHAGSSVNVQLTGAGGAVYGLGSNYADGEYLMPYYVSLNNATPIAVICDDFNHTVSIGDQWTATISTFSNLALTRFGTANATQYHEAAWIASQISSNSALADIAGAQFAIWALFSSNTPMVPGEAQWMSLAATASANNYWGMNFSNWEILTPLNPTSPQEYFFEVPEPGALVDLTVGLVAFAGLWNLKRRRLLQQRVNAADRDFTNR
ncbi:MAG: hypothetical protein WA655_14090 [Candidatus Korobacteraceae bacterium]